jgi:hypothetical protein
MSTKALTRSLQTGDMTVMSNNTSVTVTGSRVSKIGPSEHSPKPQSCIHLNLNVKKQEGQPCVLEATEELGLILCPEDAIEMGMMLVAMGLEAKGEEEVATITQRINALVEEFR